MTFAQGTWRAAVLVVTSCALLSIPECSRARRLPVAHGEAEDLQRQVAFRGAEQLGGGEIGDVLSSLRGRSLLQTKHNDPEAAAPVKAAKVQQQPPVAPEHSGGQLLVLVSKAWQDWMGIASYADISASNN